MASARRYVHSTFDGARRTHHWHSCTASVASVSRRAAFGSCSMIQAVVAAAPSSASTRPSSARAARRYRSRADATADASGRLSNPAAASCSSWSTSAGADDAAEPPGLVEPSPMLASDGGSCRARAQAADATSIATSGTRVTRRMSLVRPVEEGLRPIERGLVGRDEPAQPDAGQCVLARLRRVEREQVLQRGP